VRFVYAGTSTLRPATSETALRVPAFSTLRVNRRSVLNGRSVTFRGTAGLPVPPGGVKVDLQVHYRGRWRTIATPRTSPAGQWRSSYRFEATRRTKTYRFRARIKPEAAYPYDQGDSRTTTVRVRGR
jgi:hypothetical protein